VKKLKKIVLWVVAAVYLICISGFISERQQGILCNKIDVVIEDSLAKRFLEPQDITDLLARNKLLSLGNPISSINTDEIEETVIANTMVKHCNVYSSVNGIITIELWQREPVVRIIDRNGKNYYLDTEGSVISMSKRFTPHLLVVNGYISTPFSVSKVENIYDKNFIGKTRRLREIHAMALYIRSHKFWNSQIEQMYLNAKGEYELIPRIGPHIIILGDAENYEEKLEKLWIFYNQGLKSTGWNKYITINLKYKDQIVCTKI
jgi:cell division protein FtsQ